MSRAQNPQGRPAVPRSFYDLAIPYGIIPGLGSENKYGRSTNVDQVKTDIWDRANSSDDQAIWVAPTAARTHAIVSSDAGDDGGSPLGAGARTIQIYGLLNWEAKEVNEVITMTGTVPVNTANEYVIIHRMKVLKKGGSPPNIGVITATAIGQSPESITAQINAGAGRTKMAVYGIPSNIEFYLSLVYFSVLAQTNTIRLDITLLFNPEPQNELLGFIEQHTGGISTAATNAYHHPFTPFKKLEGPGILKLDGTSSGNNADVAGGFDGVLVDI